MKIDELENYSIQITEKYMRYYYSAEAKILKNETTTYDIVENTEIPTSTDTIKISNFITAGDEIFGIYLEYYNENAVLKTVELNFDNEVTIKLLVGNPDVSRVSLCTLKIVKK